MGVTMIEETLQTHQKQLIEAVAVAHKELADLEGSKSALLHSVDVAKTSLEEKRAAFLSAHTAREEAKASVTVAESALAEAKESQKESEATHAALGEEKVAIDVAYKDHFQTPMDAQEGPHYNDLKPFVDKLGLEESLSKALPASCVKTKEQRGGFDDLVLAELGKALAGKIETLDKSIADEASTLSQRKGAVAAAEAEVEAKHAVEKSASEAFEAAAGAQHEAEATLRQAEQDWTSFEPRVQEATENHRSQDTKRIEYEDGALKDFNNLRDKEAAPAAIEAEEEAAPAGA
jgi:chromosome segregation ATPase